MTNEEIELLVEEAEEIKLFIETDENNRVLKVYRSDYLTDTTGLHEIDYGENFCQFACGHFIDKHEIHDINACHNYIYENGEIRLATDEEKSVEMASFPEPVEPEPTEQEQMRADIEYLAIMTGVEL